MNNTLKIFFRGDIFNNLNFLLQSQFVPSYINANGTFGMVEAGEWKSYLPMPNFPEYPSATTAICYAHSEAMRRSLNSDGLKWAVDISKIFFFFR